MNFMLCGSLFNVESLFNCISSSSKEKTSGFSLLVDKRLEDYPYLLDLENMRVSVIDSKHRFLNTPKSAKKIPAIFTTKDVKGKPMSKVIHQEVASFYTNYIIETFESKKPLKVHIVLNDVHILLTSHPILDNKDKMIGCTLIEIPYLKAEELIIPND